MRRLMIAVAVLALGALVTGCPKNPLGPAGAGTNNGTTYGYVSEALVDAVLFAPQSPLDITTRAPKFGGPIFYSWGGASTTGIAASGGTPVSATDATVTYSEAPPTDSVLLYNGGIAGPSDLYIRWVGTKGPDPTDDYSSFTMFFAGNQVNFNLAATAYRGFTFFARGTGNFGVSLSGGNPGDGYSGPYKGYNFYIKMFGSELDANNWRQITVLFSEMTQLYGASVDINEVLSKSWGLQFEQQPPLATNFQLDVDYVRFF